MEISLRLILITTVILITAGVVLTIMTGEVEGFSNALDNNTQNAECSLWETRYDNADTADKQTEISNEAPTKCGDIGGGGENGGDDPEAGTCDVEEEKNCYEGTCEWTGSECVPK